mgnify:CR=1 FL=1
MSHAWNACGSHIPQGFKSPILRHGSQLFGVGTICVFLGYVFLGPAPLPDTLPQLLSPDIPITLLAVPPQGAEDS